MIEQPGPGAAASLLSDGWFWKAAAGPARLQRSTFKCEKAPLAVERLRWGVAGVEQETWRNAARLLSFSSLLTSSSSASHSGHLSSADTPTFIGTQPPPQVSGLRSEESGYLKGSDPLLRLRSKEGKELQSTLVHLPDDPKCAQPQS